VGRCFVERLNEKSHIFFGPGRDCIMPDENNMYGGVYSCQCFVACGILLSLSCYSFLITLLCYHSIPFFLNSKVSCKIEHEIW
jgi:hypothetical protein